ncbi:MAG: benzoate-CoA ligase family protein [Gammaproteobacteria bacterium]|nr:benzoate-CoA ligase family protein [Gammaproteobacteria bacterium]
MPGLSQVDRAIVPPNIVFPQDYNAAYDLLQRNLQAGRGDKPAFIDDRGSYTYNELERRSSAFANVLRDRGVQMEQRILLCLLDSIDFPVVFLGAIKVGVVPVAVNTLLTPDDYRYMLQDSRAQMLLVSEALLPLFEPLLDESSHLKSILVSGADEQAENSLCAALAASNPECVIAPTRCDDMCFWLYSSGSTGAPKGTVHKHSSLIQTAELYARAVLELSEQDIVFSAAKLFFAYGLGNGMTFPMSVGGTAVLMAERPTPEAVFARLTEHQPTLFFGAPTLFAGMLASADLPDRDQLSLRYAVSAGESLPEHLGKRWLEQFGVDVLDGIGSTEMLHIYLSNQPQQTRYGTTGVPVPGYELRVVDDDGHTLPPGEIGELQIKGPSSAIFYWNNREKTLATFNGQWVRSGDKYHQDEDGYFVFHGRSDDMLKVSGIYVSPIEVEAALMTHPAVLEAAVVGREDADELVKPAAYVVLQRGHERSEALATALKSHVKTVLAPYKCPRWFEFVDELPKTATGKIQRFKLRQAAAV